MKRLSIHPFLFCVAVLSASLLAETSPWPFPSRQGSSVTTSIASPRTVTIAFWNIEWFPGKGPNSTRAEQTRQINAVHADLTQVNPDILGMEEVAGFEQAGVAVQPLRGFKVDVCANFPAREGQDQAQEVAIASRFPALSAWAEQWKSAGVMTPPRGFAFAAYEAAPRQLILVYGLHLKSNRGDINENIAMRKESVHQLLSHMKAMEAAYGKLGTITWIVGGDFNTSLDDPRYTADTSLRDLISSGLLWTWQNVPVASRATLPPSPAFPAACFDHIFYRNATLRRAWVASTSTQSSDHRAIVATFDLPR
jgi:endonuclease/exonuclease/phosphatase (EEP) superfamily protein YafD